MEEALKREIFEETGLSIHNIKLISLKESIFSHKFHEKKHFIFIDYMCNTDSSNVILKALTWLILFKLQFSIPIMREGRVINLIPLLGSFDDNGVIRFAEIRINILAFIPLGVYICMLQTKWPFVKKVLEMVVLALAFEITQFIFAIGRADITDVLANTLGGIIGIGIYALLFKVLKGRTNKVINVLSAVFTGLALLLVALLLTSHRWVIIK